MYGDRWGHFLRTFITADETWVKYVPPETTQSSREWRLPDELAPRRGRIEPSRKKVMLTVFWDRNGVIMTDFFPQQQRVGIDGSYYAELIRRLRQHSREKRPDLIHRMWRLLHDNAPINSTPEICVELHRNNFEVVPHPPYKPDLAPSDYHLFKNLKSWQRGRTFANQEEM